jgi:hypothetical protein
MVLACSLEVIITSDIFLFEEAENRNSKQNA